ncbi:MAG: site-specific integrase [Phaeodactylibacter sp.]|nr:site-specific integrase [Phaeodactylibacter sp.]MCB9299939.1 site-specific integrase [Lewinellaceae bacterium]
MATKVFLREKKISKGRKSLYLDFYPAIRHPKTGKETRREFLGLYIFEKPRNPFETQHNKSTRAIAENIRNKQYQEIQNGTYGFQSDAKKKKSFIDFFKQLTDQRYTSKGNYDNWLSSYRYFSEYFDNNLTMGDLSVQTLNEYRDYLLGLDLAQNTKHTYFNKVKAAVKQAFKNGHISENYASQAEGIKAEETKREFVTLDELKQLAKTECDNPVLKKAFLFSALTGLRFIDCQLLRWKDLQQNSKGEYFIRYRQKKTKGQETLPLPLSARELLGEAREPEQPVFKGLTYSAWQNVKLREWVMRAGIRKKITFHCARHSFATIQLTLGTDIYTVSKLLGHRELKTTQIYAKIIDQKKTEAMNKLNDLKL